MINDYEATQPIVSESGYEGQDKLSNDDVISYLNGLIQTNKDGEDGYRQAADGVEDSRYKALFAEYSLQRAKFAGDLQQIVRGLGGEYEEGGSFAGMLHRGWMDIKSVLSQNEEKAVLNECERGEDSAKDAYEKALKQAFPADIADTLREQSQAIHNAHDQIKALRNEANRSASA